MSGQATDELVLEGSPYQNEDGPSAAITEQERNEAANNGAPPQSSITPTPATPSKNTQKRSYDPSLWQSDDLLGPAASKSSPPFNSSASLAGPSQTHQFSASTMATSYSRSGVPSGVGENTVNSNTGNAATSTGPGTLRRSSTASSTGSSGFIPFSFTSANISQNSSNPYHQGGEGRSNPDPNATTPTGLPSTADMDRRGSSASTNASSISTSNHSCSSSSYNLSSHGLPDLPSSFSPASSAAAQFYPSTSASFNSPKGANNASHFQQRVTNPVGTTGYTPTETRTGLGLVGLGQAFSPLSPHVEPFSPSSGGSSGFTQTSAHLNYTSGVEQPSLGRTNRSHSLAPPASTLPPTTLNHAHQRACTEERNILAASTTSTADTGYASQIDSNTGYTSRPGQLASHGRNDTVAAQGRRQGDRSEAAPCTFENHSLTTTTASARLRAFSEAGAFGIIPGSQYNPAHHFLNQRQAIADQHNNQANSSSRQNGIPEEEEALRFESMHRYGFPPHQHQQQRMQYGIDPTAGLKLSQSAYALSSSSTAGNNRVTSVGRTLDSIDTNASSGRFSGYPYSATGPPSISDHSTDRGMGPEEIFTIFVVGFPEDIQEREFINMFLFARGFEAATLKIPASTAAARDRDAAAAAAVSAIAATLPSYAPPPPLSSASMEYGYSTPSSAGHSYDHLNNSLYEESLAQQQHVEGTQRMSSALAAAALSASASSASLNMTSHTGTVSLGHHHSSLATTSSNKKQIIGFAKFRTRDDAMEARDLLSGRRIDHEKGGSVLKAEMAKKNLHIKRSPSDPIGVEPINPYPEQSSRYNQYLSSVISWSAGRRENTAISALDRLAEKDREWRSRMNAIPQADSRDYNGVDSVPQQQHQYRDRSESDLERKERDIYQDRERGQREARSRFSSVSTSNSSNNDPAWDAFHSVPDARASLYAFRPDPKYPSSTSARESPETSYPNLGRSLMDRTTSVTSSSSSPPVGRSFPGTSSFGKSLLQQLDEQEERECQLGTPAPGFGASAYSSGIDNDSSGNGSAVTARRKAPPAALPTSELANNVLTGQAHIANNDFQRLALESANTITSPFTNPLSPPSFDTQYAQQGYGLAGPSSHTPTSVSAGNYTANDSTLNQGQRTSFTSPTSPTFADFRMPRHHHHQPGGPLGSPIRPDDNNMPISTLYIGGLPTILPNLTGPMSAIQLEENLREVFSVCPGFRRLSYRQKSQGPMCFVEFEDVTSATRALTEMYGHTLGGLIKSGIRVAYSKNPLGVRGYSGSGSSAGGGGGGPGSPTPLSPYFASDLYAFGQQQQIASPTTMGLNSVSTPTLSARQDNHYQSHYQQPQINGFSQPNNARNPVDAAVSPSSAGRTFSAFSMH